MAKARIFAKPGYISHVEKVEVKFATLTGKNDEGEWKFSYSQTAERYMLHLNDSFVYSGFRNLCERYAEVRNVVWED